MDLVERAAVDDGGGEETGWIDSTARVLATRDDLKRKRIEFWVCTTEVGGGCYGGEDGDSNDEGRDVAPVGHVDAACDDGAGKDEERKRSSRKRQREMQEVEVEVEVEEEVEVEVEVEVEAEVEVEEEEVGLGAGAT